jgi:hypothetical protein
MYFCLATFLSLFEGVFVYRVLVALFLFGKFVLYFFALLNFEIQQAVLGGVARIG